VVSLAGEATAPALAALAQFGATEGRGETTRLGPATKPLLLVDESYNANLASMAAALEVYAGVRAPGGPQLHAKLKDAVLASGPTKIFLVGPSMSALANALEDAPVEAHALAIEDVQETILAGLAHGDAVMVKGSKGVRLAGLVQAIRERFQ
jgi:UDP-N-acetylmuramoyl-tripeptide--D-alanyl-D-alanine ligase